MKNGSMHITWIALLNPAARINHWATRSEKNATGHLTPPGHLTPLSPTESSFLEPAFEYLDYLSKIKMLVSVSYGERKYEYWFCYERFFLKCVCRKIWTMNSFV